MVRDLRIWITHLPSRETGFIQDRIDRSPFFFKPLDREAGPAGISHAHIRHRVLLTGSQRRERHGEGSGLDASSIAK